MADISEIVERLDDAAAILGVGISPADVTTETFEEVYIGLHAGALEYTKEDGEPKKMRGKILLELLADIEFQASWHVLRKCGYNDEQIMDVPAHIRTMAYRGTLYARRDTFPFFNAREAALHVLSHAELIRYEDYGHPEVPSPRTTIPN